MKTYLSQHMNCCQEKETYSIEATVFSEKEDGTYCGTHYAFRSKEDYQAFIAWLPNGTEEIPFHHDHCSRNPEVWQIPTTTPA